MSEDPQQRSPDRAATWMALNWKAVAFGLFSDILATTVLSVLIFSLLGARLSAEGSSADSIDSALIASHGYLLLSLIAGLGCTVLGGYVGARIAGRLEYYHGLMTGVCVLIFGELMMIGSTIDYPWSYRLLGDLLLIPAAIYGGYLRKLATRK